MDGWLRFDIGHAGMRPAATDKQHKSDERGNAKCRHHHGHGQGGPGTGDPDEWRGRGSDGELQHAQQCRRTPGAARVTGQRQSPWPSALPPATGSVAHDRRADR